MSLFTPDAISVCVGYVVCALLLAYTLKAKKTDTLHLSITYTFFAVGFFMLLNLILQFTASESHSLRSFYDVNFVHFVGVMLILNLLLHRKKRKEEKPQVG